MTDLHASPATGATPAPRRRRRLRRFLIVTGSVLGSVVLIVGAVAAWFLWAPAPTEPSLDADVVQGTLEVDGRTREYLAMVPRDLPANAPIVLVFHGSNMDAAGMRAASGYRFDELAVERGYVAVYPQGYEKTWHDCRAQTPYPARTENIDDVAFVRALVEDVSANFGTSRDAVFATGLSNGGHMSIRLGAEAPDLVRGIAAFAAASPAEENDTCEWAGTGMPTMFVLGTADPINPFEGGAAGVGGSLGQVRSAEDSAAFVAERNGDAAPGEGGSFTNTDASGESDVTRTVFDGPAPVVLFAVEGGGHVVPNPVYAQPRIMGATSRYLDGPLAAVDFFLAGGAAG